MSIIKFLISVLGLVLALSFLYRTTDYYQGLFIIAIVTIVFAIKNYRLYKAFQREVEYKTNFFETIFNSSTDIITYRNVNGTILACNEALVQAFDTDKKNMIGKDFEQILNEITINIEETRNLSKIVTEKTKIAIETKTSQKFFGKFEFTNKISGYYNVLISPVCDSNNKVIGTVMVSRDVTAEHKASQATIEKEQQLKCLIENIPMCAFIKDKNGNYKYGNTAFEKVMNCVNGNIKTIELSKIYDKEYLDFVKAEDANVYKTKQTYVTVRRAFFPRQNFWARVHKSPVFDADGNIEYLVILFENIDNEKEIEEQKEYFVETLIHDLKIPTLAQLRGLELIRNETLGKISLDQKELVTQIESSCRYILDMISMVLKTYRFEIGKKTLNLQKFSILEILEESLNEISEIAKEKNVEFICHNRISNTLIEADRKDLKTVFLNLLSNAITYSNHNEKVIINTAISANKLQVEIISKGISLSERECNSIFKRFTDENKPKYATIGHGIGLYLCKKIIESHYGEICASTDGQNYNNFTFTIPLEHTNSNNIEFSKF